MAHLIYHRYPEWELVRNESVVSQRRRKAIQESHEKVDKDRAETNGLNWESQRYVDQVVPAEVVNPDNFDTFNYKYQVYARPPPVQCEPRSLAEVTDQPPGLKYNVKRMAVDKPFRNQDLNCAGHYTQHPWEFADCPKPSEKKGDCSKNNNTLSVCHGYLNSLDRSSTSKSAEKNSTGFTENPILEISPAQFKTDNCHFSKDETNELPYTSEVLTTTQRPVQSCNLVTVNNNNITGEASNCENVNRSPSYSSSCATVSSKTVSDSKGSLSLNNNGEPQPPGVSCSSTKSKTEMASDTNNMAHDTYTKPVRRRGKRRIYTENTGADHVASLLIHEDQNNNGSKNMSPEAGVEIDLFTQDDMGLNENAVNSLCETANSQANDLQLHGGNTHTIHGKASIIPRKNHDGHIEENCVPKKCTVSEYPLSPQSTQVHFICRNNNATNMSEKKLKYNLACSPIKPCKNKDRCSLSKKMLCRPRQPEPNLPRDRALLCFRDVKCESYERYDENKHGPLECRVVSRCVSNDKADFEDPLLVCEPKHRSKTPEIGYGTYKIVGGLQYRHAPPPDLLSDLKLPPDLSEYQEFIRRCPKYEVGRYDRSNPANEMLLPANKATINLRSSRSPFAYARNPNAGFKPSQFDPLPSVDLSWKLPAFMRINE